eukprot:TRINITY_DN15046_c0_g1_i1.p1 TRINITY_DN15046_c0_g1~~TRINITY_DN15046_c0_g1_i1.p1  ORF type:complete len:568 (+),score=109.89 TRINITY_DN15046_c0_g1_i1:114-1817(+)
MGSCVSRVKDLPVESLIARGQKEAVSKLLRRKKLNPNDLSSTWAPMHVATWCGNKEMLHLLILYGGNVNLPNKHTGDTPLHYAVMKKHTELVHVLLHAGAKPNLQNSNGSAALHLAVEEGSDEIAKVLVSRGSDVNLPDRTGRTPFDLAQMKSASVVQLLQPYVNAQPPAAGGQPLTTSSSHSSQLDTLDQKGEWISKIKLRDLEIGRMIGSGAFAQVFEAKWRSTKVAVKKLFKTVADDDDPALQELMAEMSAMRSVKNHPNVVLLMGVVFEPPTLGIVMEYLPRGSLYDLLHRQKQRPSLELATRMALDVARGMAFLHSAQPPIVHRDLKSPNLLITDGFSIKITDFGLTRSVSGTGIHTAAGTPAWMAPEVLRGEHYSVTADIYSFGIVLWELLTGKSPHPRVPYYELIQKVPLGLRPPIPEDTPDALAKLMRECWSDDPLQRPTFAAIVERLEVVFAGYPRPTFHCPLLIANRADVFTAAPIALKADGAAITFDSLHSQTVATANTDGAVVRLSVPGAGGSGDDAVQFDEDASEKPQALRESPTAVCLPEVVRPASVAAPAQA